jgi:UDP-N-acetyl-D-galactosamine dehydrogenase
MPNETSLQRPAGRAAKSRPLLPLVFKGVVMQARASDLAGEPFRIGVIGLGYVGLPLAVAFAKIHDTRGMDLKRSRIEQLRSGVDVTREMDPDVLRAADMTFTSDIGDLADCNVFIVTVPTPVDQAKRPDLGPLLGATRAVGTVLKRGDVVIYESTVYPGVTEDVCAPVLAEVSGLTFNQDFFCGYSPERVNPGDRLHSLTDVVKVTAGSTAEAAERVDRLYASVIRVGTHRASSIRVAEAAKVIENTQRDINIALVNELAMIFNRLDIDTEEVLRAASTKWNFLPFRPGLVGGHCIGVDPYYLTHKAQEVGYHPEVILAGRRINDGMGAYVAGQMVRLMASRTINPIGAKVLVLGLTFKEDCPDLRNTRVIDIVRELRVYGVNVVVHDPCADPDEAHEAYGVTLDGAPVAGAYDGVMLAVAHSQFRDMPRGYFRAFCCPGGVLYDVKSVLPRDDVDGRL